MWSCGGDSGAFFTECVVLEGVREQFGGSVRIDIALQREDRGVGGEKHRVVGGVVEEEKKRNGPTNSRTCTSVVRAHMGADKKALLPNNIIRRKKNGSTKAGTCTSVVRAHRGDDKNAELVRQPLLGLLRLA